MKEKHLKEKEAIAKAEKMKKDVTNIDSIYKEAKPINVPIKQTHGLNIENKIVKNYEYEQNKNLFA